MRIQKINENTLRIFLSFAELADRDISMTELFQRSNKTEQLFWEMISKAGDEVEFVLDKPFWIQATIMSSDEFVITVVKQDGTEVFPEGEKQKKKRPARSREHVYRFEDWDALVSGVASVADKISGRTSVYHLEHCYYLVLSTRCATGPNKLLIEANLKEYGEKANLTRIYLNEYGKLVMRNNALQTIKKHFICQ
ncbi:MAG TPA: adaptor protein MecA [Desulfobacteria bacterium]|nr:adaptor protein MecA [Desulfobacteria bacterium]